MKIALIGYGKMGKEIEKVAQNLGHGITHRIASPNQLGNLLKNRPEVTIEFTHPDSAFENLKFCLENGLACISGTTGWLDQYPEIEKICFKNEGTFLHSSNFSIGVNLFFEMNEWLANKMRDREFKIEIEEVHHTEKKDSPSGTAIRLAEGIQDKNETISGWINDISTDHTKLGIVSKRIPNVPGTHSVTYSSNLESVKIEHVAHDRSVFAEGVVKVAEWIKNERGIFTMSDFINH